MQARVNTYLQAVAPLGREAGRIRPFLATCTPTSDNPYLNYAMPEDGAEPGGEDVFDLEAWFAHRHRKPRLEYVTAAAPAVEAVLLAAGFAVEGRLPLMVWDTHATTDLAAIDDVEVVLARSDDLLFDMMAVQAEAYESSAPPSRDDVRFARGAVERASSGSLRSCTSRSRQPGAVPAGPSGRPPFGFGSRSTTSRRFASGLLTTN